MRKTLRLLAAMSLFTGYAAIADSPLPASKWDVKIAENSKLDLVEKDGCLLLDFNIIPDQIARSGHRSFHYGYADLMLKSPLKLGNDIERVVYEFADMSGKNRSACEIYLRPVIRDAEGELFIFEPKPYTHLQSGKQTWGKWMSTSFYAGEAGAAASDIYFVEGKKGNAFPDGKLELVGFKLTVRIYTSAENAATEKIEPVKGKVALGDFDVFKQKFPYETPFAYIDSLLVKKGAYTLAVQVLNEFQGVPVTEFKKSIDFDPDNLASRKQKLEIPLGPDDVYRINYQITDAGGKLVTDSRMQQQVLGNPDKATLKPLDTGKAPALGHVRINPDHAKRGVYERNEPMRVELRVFPKDKKSLEVSWKLLAYGFEDVIDQGTSQVDFGSDVFKKMEIMPKTETGRDAYRLLVEVKDQGKLVDAQTYYLGFRTDPNISHDRVGELPDRREIKKRPYNRTTYVLPPGKAKTETQAEAHFREYLAEAKQIAPSLTYMIDLVDFEILPGVFDYATLDKIMDAAADYGCKVTVRLGHADEHGKNLYRWLKYSRQFNYDGTIASGHEYYGAYDVSDKNTRKLWLDSYRSLYNRYNKHTAFEGYYIMLPGGEWSVVDQPWMGTIVGYSPTGTAGFRDYLKGIACLTLEQVNKRWDTNYKSWDEVTVPMPDLRGGAMPDLRMQWVDFNRFKASLATQGWFPEAVNSIRKYDDKRVTIIYGAPKKYKNLFGLLDYCHNGGNHYGNDLGEHIEPWEKGAIGWITEPHHPHRWAEYGDPAGKGWVLDWSVWVMTAQAGGGGANLHIYYMPNPTLELIPHYGGTFAYDALEKYKPILSELHAVTIKAPEKQVAVKYDPNTLYCKHRTTFNARSTDLKRWFELLDTDSVSYEELNPDRLDKYKLIMPNIIDEVISLETLQLYDKAVRSGSKIIITANTGKYVPELGKEPFMLLKKLGINPPSSPYCGKGEQVVAEVDAKEPLFLDKTRKLAFQTTESFRRQFASDEIRKKFWQYPYRWIPETDYFGYYPGHKVSDGKVIARFPDGGAAVSLHQVGKGEAVVFWGTPDMSDDKLKGMMGAAADWAGIVNPRKGNVLQYSIEGDNDKLKRHYLLVYNEKPGTYTQKFPLVADGDWFLDDIISSQRMGRYDGANIRNNGLELTWQDGYSPLKIIRMNPVASMKSANWKDKYKIVPDKSNK